MIDIGKLTNDQAVHIASEGTGDKFMDFVIERDENYVICFGDLGDFMIRADGYMQFLDENDQNIEWNVIKAVRAIPEEVLTNTDL